MKDESMERVKLFSLLILGTLFAHVVTAQPKLALDKMEVDMGILYSGQHGMAMVKISNIGNESLNITGVYPSCGCTTVKSPKSVLAPGESDLLKIEFNSTGYTTRAEKHISITSNDPTAATVDVKLVADVRIELEPATHSLTSWMGPIAIGKVTEQTVAFTNVTNHPLTIREIKSSTPDITATFDKKSLAPDDTLHVVVKAKPDKPGYANEHITIELDSRNQPEVELRVPFIGTSGN